MSSSDDGGDPGHHQRSAGTGEMNASIVTCDSPCTVYIAPKQFCRYGWTYRGVLQEEQTVIYYSTTASVTNDAGIQIFTKVGSYGALDESVTTDAVNKISAVDFSKGISPDLMPKNKTLNELLSSDASALEQVWNVLNRVDPRSAGMQSQSQSSGRPIGEAIEPPTSGWRIGDVIPAATDRSKAVRDFCWSTASSANDVALDTRDFQAVPHDTTLLVLRDEVETGILFDHPERGPCAFEFSPAHCRR